MIGIIPYFIALVAGFAVGWIASLCIADKRNIEEETNSLESIQREKEESTMSLRSTPLNDGEDFID